MLDLYGPQAPGSNVQWDSRHAQLLKGIVPSPAAADFLCLAMAVFCIDKLLLRLHTPDAWTRDIELRIPVHQEAVFRAASLAQIATDPATDWTQATVRRYAKTETLMLTTIECLWGPLGAETPVRVILVADTSKTCGYQIALITTDLTSTPAEIVERYADRWPIEVCFEEAKHQAGVGDARNRTRKAVERTVPFQFLAMTLTIVWYAASGHHPDVVAAHRARAPWYQTKTTPSLADMLAKLRRTIIAAQYHPGQGRTPTPAQITEVQHAWAAAGL